MSIKVGINGFGRIGRNIYRAALGRSSHRNRSGKRHHRLRRRSRILLKYDSILGNLTNTVTHTDNSISVDGKASRFSK